MGTRCGYTVVPKELVRDGQSLNAMWNRRQCTKFNGASYIIQRGAAAIYTEEGERQIEETLAYYRNNARVIKEGLEAAGFTMTRDTRPIRNPWLIENRFAPAARVYRQDDDGTLVPDEWSWTNVLLIAEKPA